MLSLHVVCVCVCVCVCMCVRVCVCVCCNHGYHVSNLWVYPCQEYNQCYVYLVEEKLAEALTSYRQMEAGEFNRVSDSRCACLSVHCVHVCMCTCVHACMCVCACVLVCICVCMFLYRCACMFVCLCVCV